MDNVKDIINRMRLVTESSTYDELAKKMGVALATINNWKGRGNVPEKHILKCIHLTKTTKEYLLYGKISDGSSSNIVTGNNNISLNGNENIVSSNHVNNTSIEEICMLLKEYGSPKFISDMKEKLLQIKALHG